VFAGGSAGVSIVLWNLPPEKFGEPVTSGRSRRRCAPSAVGRPQAARMTQPTGKASAAAVSAVRRRAERDTTPVSQAKLSGKSPGTSHPGPAGLTHGRDGRAIVATQQVRAARPAAWGAAAIAVVPSVGGLLLARR
jgi:hypothetical protein